MGFPHLAAEVVIIEQLNKYKNLLFGIVVTFLDNSYIKEEVLKVNLMFGSI
jgi:hypothetical protein